MAKDMGVSLRLPVFSALSYKVVGILNDMKRANLKHGAVVLIKLRKLLSAGNRLQVPDSYHSICPLLLMLAYEAAL